MGNLHLSFAAPWYLLLLGLLPLLWWTSFHSLAGLGSGRRFLALLIRSLVIVGIVCAIASVQWVWTSDRKTVMYLLDQSASIPQAKRQLMLDFVIRSVAAHRNAERQDKVGIIVFGREASVEIPPFDDDIPQLGKLESYLERIDATNLEGAMKLAQASMSADAARRIVIVSDGNENLGNAMLLAPRLAASGIGVDVVPIPLQTEAEVLVEKVDIPADVRKGQPFEARIVLQNYVTGEVPREVKGTLRITQSLGQDERLVGQEEVVLLPGKNVFPIRLSIDQPAPYTYRAEFIPAAAADDLMRENNQATAYTYVRGQGRVLMIEDWNAPGQFDLLVDRLRESNIEVNLQKSNQLFASLEELLAYDAVILAGVPRVSGDTASAISSFTDEQIELLIRNTQQLGCGLLMIGGPNALGNGGWADTKIEEAMPVNFRIQNTKVQAVGALAMIMHASEMAQGNHWQKVIARKAIESMGPGDYAGVLHWDFSGDRWLWGGQKGLLPVGPNRREMLSALGRMTPGDMPQFDPAMQMALRGLNATDASLKHCIIISDGDPSDPSPSTLQAFKQSSISISTVAVATHGPAESARLEEIAKATGGRYYQTQDPSALPKIYQREARRIARPLNFEPDGGVEPRGITSHPVLEGLGANFPSTQGFVLTEVKENPLVQVLIQSPQPENPENATILAVWNFGLGRTAVLTTDAGARWAEPWTRWEGYDKFFSQLIRWLMRPSGDTGKYSLATKAENGRIEVVVTALDEESRYENFLQFGASALGPDLQPLPLELKQTAPGRYVGSIAADQAGSYFLNVVPGPGKAPLTSGVTVPYSDEYRAGQTNEALLESLSKVQPAGGLAGTIYPPLTGDAMESLLQPDPFRDGLAMARSIQEFWPWLVFAAACLFLGDVAVRRVRLDFARFRTLFRRQAEDAVGTATAARLKTLKTQKERVGQALDRYRGGDFTLQESREQQTRGNQSPRRSVESSSPDSPQEESSYTQRLLEAKRRAQKPPGNLHPPSDPNP